MNRHIKSKGSNIIISAPSGVGKSTLISQLIQQDENLVLSVSATTRTPRPAEKEGIHYYFKSKEEFYSLIAQNAFVEYAEVFGNFYGTLVNDVEQNLLKGNDILFDIDWQGANLLKNKMPEDTISIFILPPSMSELERRLKHRKSDELEVIRYRMAKARSEISHYYQYDYIIVNDDLTQALKEIQAIIIANRLRKERLMDLNQFIQKL